jgi:hypothetical protein
MEVENEERDWSEFDFNIMKLFDVCEKILKISEKRSMSSKRNPFLTRLEKYKKTYNKTEPNEHTVYFENIFDTNKKFILLGPQRDAWLTEGSIIVGYGQDCGMKTDIEIHLSSIYRTSCKVRDEVQEEIEGLPNTSDTSEIRYPSEFLLLLYRIFREVVPSETDRKKLSTHISRLESEAGIRSNNNGDGNELSGLFDMAANMAEQVSGSKIPRDKMPGKNDFGKMLGDLVNDPKTKSLLGGVMEKFKDSQNIGDVVKNLVDGVGGLGGQQPNNQNTNQNNQTNSNTNTSNSTAQLEDNPEVGSVNDEFEDFE